jgi:flagellar biosynthesis protein FlhG
MITANVAASLASAGKRTLVIDADLGLANLDVILGINPSHNLRDVLQGDLGIDDVLVQTQGGFELLPASSGIQEGTLLTPSLAESLNSIIHTLDKRYDAILFDAGAGIGEVVLYFANISDTVLLVVTPEPTSVMDAYATIKVLARRYGQTDISLVVNQANPENPIQSGMAVANHLRRVASQFLSKAETDPVRIGLLGAIPSDPTVARAINTQQLLVTMAPESPATCGIANLADSLKLQAAKPSSLRNRIPSLSK